ncbi:formylglycine-generating enzyme family protein, partial [bacterium]|nr:formylglycine-generating enzyme family protein [bacterium]
QASPLEMKELIITDGPIPGMKFVQIPAGSFMMGSPESEEGRNENEVLHQVIISEPFEIMTTQVTQAQWVALIRKYHSFFRSLARSNPSCRRGDNLPVENVSWKDVQQFIKELNVQESGKEYRLPTEAEWEYACRAGTTTRFNIGDTESDLAQAGFYKANSGSWTHMVGQQSANAWGLYDMHGNVWEWCSDWYGDYPSGSVKCPTGASNGTERVRRGGCWLSDARYCRSALRNSNTPSYRSSTIGFRLVRLIL